LSSKSQRLGSAFCETSLNLILKREAHGMTTEERIDYYRSKEVRDRIVEFLGGDTHHAPTSRFIVGGDELATHLDDPKSITNLQSSFDQGLEIFRSLWDENSLLADFDVEYVNFDYPGEAFTEPERAFELLQPVATEIEHTLRSYGIPALHLLSGRGHHFVWRIRRDCPEFRGLAKLGVGTQIVSPPGEDQSDIPATLRVSKELACAFSGLGLLMEFLAHGIKERVAPACAIPVELTAVEVGPSALGREMISIDISEYGDPLPTRLIRTAFSVYLKPWQQAWAIEQETLDRLPPLFIAPLNGRLWTEGIRTMRNAASMIELAGTTSARIPDGTASMGRLINDYEASKIAEFHRWFYSQKPHGPDQWDDTYDRLPLDVLPLCVRTMLEQPNDLLLRPGHIRQLVRIMLALGWHPRHIAGLIHSKYARPFGWTQFRGYDRAMRADFYTRIFAGSFVSGYDDLVDFNCFSAQEQKICPVTECGFNLLHFKQSALNRRSHDQLAHRPFNRLLLQPEHS
jgi:hypothetical protein